MTPLSSRERQKIARREAILDAARTVFLSGNLHHATVSTVASEADVSKGTVYLYFSSKEALLAELLHEGLQLLAAQLSAAYAQNEVFTPDVRVGRLAGAYLEFAESQPMYIQLRMAFESGQLALDVSDERAKEIRALTMRGVELIEQAIREGISNKVFQRIDVRQMSRALWSALNGALLVGWDGKRSKISKASVEKQFQIILEVFLLALKHEAAR